MKAAFALCKKNWAKSISMSATPELTGVNGSTHPKVWYKFASTRKLERTCKGCECLLKNICFLFTPAEGHNLTVNAATEQTSWAHPRNVLSQVTKNILDFSYFGAQSKQGPGLLTVNWCKQNFGPLSSASPLAIGEVKCKWKSHEGHFYFW